MTAKEVTPDVESILPEQAKLTVDGIPVEVSRLNLREFLALINIITTGMGNNIQRVDFSAPQDELVPQMLGLLVASVPRAADETISFVRVVVKATDKADAPALDAYLRNPDLEVFMDVIAKVIEQEADEMKALMGKAVSHFRRMQSLWKVTGS